MSGPSGGGGSQNTVTQTQQIPQFEQDFARSNQDLAASISSQPYPTYQGALVQPQTGLQDLGQNVAVNSALAYQPGLNAGMNTTSAALDPSGVNGYANASGMMVGAANNYGAQSAGQIGQGINANGLNAYSGAAASGIGQSLSQNGANQGTVASYMNPYIQQALAPQMQDLQLQLSQQQRGIDAQATQAGAFGDARQGSAQALQNYYGNQAMNELVGTGYNNAYSQAMGALQNQQNIGLQGSGQLANLAGLQGTEQGLQLQGAQQYGSLGNLALSGAQQYGNIANILGSEQQTQLAGGNQLAQMGGLQQQYGITGANAVYNAGSQQQQLGQQQLNAAYQQYLNQINWPTQMLNIRESALSNSPYNIQTATTLPNANSTAQGFGTLAGAAGLLGALGGSGANTSPFGGQPIQTPR